MQEGGCTYEEKARRAEKAGAQALIIARDFESYIDSREFHETESNYDGTGHSIAIPTLIVSPEDGKKLTKLVQRPSQFMFKDNDSETKESVILKAEIEVSSADM